MVIEARQLTKSYTLYPNATAQLMDLLGIYRLLPWRQPSYGTHTALSAVDLTIREGERVGVIGRNGAGKTTLLKLITQSAEPSGGTLAVKGNVQALMQVGLGFHPEFTGRENIRASLLYSGLTSEERQEAKADIIEFCELGDYLDQPVKTYSLGMQSRLQFACATAIKPEILIVDEILGAGDAYFSVKSSKRMERLTKSGCTLLLVSHSMAQILQFCHRCIWIDGGKVVRDGPAKDVVVEYEGFMYELSKGLEPKLKKPVPASGNAASATSPTEMTDRPPAAALEHPEPKEESAETQELSKDIPDWYLSTLTQQMSDAETGDNDDQAESNTGERWVNDSRIRIFKARVLGPSGKPQFTFKSLESMRIEITVEASEDGTFDCWFVALLYSSDGKPVVRHVSKKAVCPLKSGQRTVATIVYDELLLGTGEYHASVAVYRDWNPADRITPNWYEILNRSLEFRVSSGPEHDPSLFHHPSSWILPAATELTT